MHTLKMKIIVDYPLTALYRKYGHSESVLRRDVEHAVSSASLIYEKQMNIKLRISDFVQYASKSGAPPYAAGCSCKTLWGGKKCHLRSHLMDSVAAANKYKHDTGAVAHVFSGCGGMGIDGIAKNASACGDKNLALLACPEWPYFEMQDRYKDRCGHKWKTLAHELGHQLGADHSFEDGKRKTGGIMDYGDGKYKGVYQFHPYRKSQVCSVLKRISSNCKGQFVTSGSDTSDPTPPSPEPGPPPSPLPRPPSAAPSTVRRRRRRRRRRRSPSPPSSPFGNNNGPATPPAPSPGGKGGKGGKGSLPLSAPGPPPAPGGGRGGKRGKGGKGSR